MNKHHLFVLLSVLFFGAVLSFTALPLFLLSIEQEFSLSHTMAGLLYGFLLGGSAVGRFLEGVLADLWGKIRCVMGAATSTVFGALALSGAPTYGVALIAAAILGVGNGLYVPAGYALVSEFFPERRGRMIGLYDSIFPISGLGAVGLNRLRFTLGSWRYGTLIISGFVGIGLLLFVLYLHATNIPSVATERPMFSLRNQIARIAHEGTTSPTFLRLSFLIIPVGIVTFGVLNFFTIFLIEVKGFTVETADIVYIVYMALGIPGKLLAGWLADRRGSRRALLWIFSFETIGLGLLTFVSPVVPLFVGITFFAVMRSGVFTVVHTHMLSKLPQESVDLLYGMFMVVLVLAGSVGSPLTGYLIDVAGFITSFTVLILILLVALFITVFLVEPSP